MLKNRVEIELAPAGREGEASLCRGGVGGEKTRLCYSMGTAPTVPWLGSTLYNIISLVRLWFFKGDSVVVNDSRCELETSVL